MTRRWMFASLVSAILVLSTGYMLGGFPWLASAVFLSGCACLVGMQRGWRGSVTLSFLFITGVAAAGIGLGLFAPAMLFAASAGLIAWDLSYFDRRLALAAPDDQRSGLEKRHLLWVGASVAVGLLIGAASLGLRLQLPFAWEALLAVGAVLGILRLLSALRASVNE